MIQSGDIEFTLSTFNFPILYQSSVIGPDSLYCGKWGKILNAYSDLDLDLTMLNIELVRAIFIYYNVFQFHVPR